MTTVYWDCYNEKTDMRWFELTLVSPTPVLPSVIRNRSVAHNNHFTKCPAFKDYYKNVYMVTSPVDMELIYDKTTGFLSNVPQDQGFFDAVVQHRGDAIGKDDPFLMSLAFSYLFVADSDCMIEQIPATMHNSDISKRVNLICGTFNIGKWFRPVEFSFEVNDFSKPIKIKRGEPLFYIRFVPKNGEKVNLVHKSMPTDTLEVVKACLFVKDSKLRLPLNTLYKLAERLYPKLWFKRKCPFSWGKK